MIFMIVSIYVFEEDGVEMRSILLFIVIFFIEIVFFFIDLVL